MSRFRIDVADLLSHAGARRRVRVAEPLEDLAGSVAAVVEPIEVDFDLDRISEGIVVRGLVTATWDAECSRCLGPLTRTLQVHVDELFEPNPVAGETYPIEGHELDLEQLVRDAVLLELPLAPHCDSPCIPDRLTESAGEQAGDVDPRWAALSQLQL